ncbi:hypothetical protein [Novosphingobium sp.]|uniref:hypothetical protein n=1 Tax=Novosphingobium sp. TaxID=1874826 RepID=UPI0028A61348|nr:hypothetical protein [Novosphingobium sp.]
MALPQQTLTLDGDGVTLGGRASGLPVLATPLQVSPDASGSTPWLPIDGARDRATRAREMLDEAGWPGGYNEDRLHRLPPILILTAESRSLPPGRGTLRTAIAGGGTGRQRHAHDRQHSRFRLAAGSSRRTLHESGPRADEDAPAVRQPFRSRRHGEPARTSNIKNDII